MKRSIIKSLSVFLTVIMTLSILPMAQIAELNLSGLFIKASAANLKTGDLIEFGSYPQSEVKDTDTLNALNKLDLEWVSYGYYCNDEKSDYMKYADVEYNGQVYRAVTFTSFRPEDVYDDCPPDDYWTKEEYQYACHQAQNGYFTGKVYWFRYEPVVWRVLDPTQGLVVSEMVLDCQPWKNEDSMCDGLWSTSSLREWLNGQFYNTAFNAEKKYIQTASLATQGYDEWCNTNDNVFLLTYEDLENELYGFPEDPMNPDETRIALSTDYAACQGTDAEVEDRYYEDSYDEDGDFIIKKGAAVWILRDRMRYVLTDGSAWWGLSGSWMASQLIGIRPAIIIDLQALSGSDNRADGAGDLDNDGKVLANDARTVLRASAQLEKLNDAQTKAADVNKDGKVLADDARQILRFSAQLQKTFFTV